MPCSAAAAATRRHKRNLAGYRCAAAVVCALTLLHAGCGNGTDGGGDDAATSACLPPVDLDCQPLYQPTFDKIFANRLAATCGSASTGASCHAEAGAMGDLVMTEADATYDALVGANGAKQRVIAGDPECSLLARRIESTDSNFMMPPGSPLSTAERCTILQWIAAGAER